MAMVFTKVGDSDNVEGRLRTVQYDVTLDTSYSTGGMAIAASKVGLKQISSIDILGQKAGTTTLNFSWDNVNSKLQAFYPTGGGSAPATVTAPVAAAPGAGTLTVTTTPDAGAVTMTGSAAKPALVGVITGALAAPALTAGAGLEVANTTDLSAIVLRIKFIQ